MRLRYRPQSLRVYRTFSDKVRASLLIGTGLIGGAAVSQLRHGWVGASLHVETRLPPTRCRIVRRRLRSRGYSVDLLRSFCSPTKSSDASRLDSLRSVGAGTWGRKDGAWLQGDATH